MVTQPLYRLIVNGRDITAEITPWLTRLQLTDNEKDQSDQLTLTTSAKFKRPSFNDRIEVFLGDNPPLSFAGLFHVQKTRVRNNRELTITATGVDFSSDLKERRNLRYEQVTPGALAKTVAGRHGLKIRTDVTRPVIDIDQINESDLNLLNRLTNEHGHIFNIKNATLYFMQREIAPPAVSLDIAQCAESEITHTNRTWYRSCKAIYHNTRLNEHITITVAAASPAWSNKATFKMTRKRSCLPKTHCAGLTGPLPKAA